MPMLICVMTVKKLFAELICDWGMSTNASVLMLVNCIDRDRPWAKSRTIMSAFGVFGVSRREGRRSTRP